MGFGDRYILLDDGATPVRVDLPTYARWSAGTNKTVARTSINGADVSTVFLGIDHRTWGIGPPLLWETMVFGGPLDGECERYGLLEDARAGHDAMVERCRLAPVAPAPSMLGPIEREIEQLRTENATLRDVLRKVRLAHDQEAFRACDGCSAVGEVLRELER